MKIMRTEYDRGMTCNLLQLDCVPNNERKWCNGIN
jgi:hypothetical protein